MSNLIMLKSKLHSAIVTGSSVSYEGSISIDSYLLQEANILPYEQVHVLDLTNGARLITYAIESSANSGAVCINGAAARLINKGDSVIILSYSSVPTAEADGWKPKIIHLSENNKILE